MSDQSVISTLNHHTGQVTWTSSHKFRETAVQPLNDEIVLLSGSSYYDNKKDVSVKALNIKTSQRFQKILKFNLKIDGNHAVVFYSLLSYTATSYQ